MARNSKLEKSLHKVSNCIHILKWIQKRAKDNVFILNGVFNIRNSVHARVQTSRSQCSWLCDLSWKVCSKGNWSAGCLWERIQTPSLSDTRSRSFHAAMNEIRDSFIRLSVHLLWMKNLCITQAFNVYDRAIWLASERDRIKFSLSFVNSHQPSRVCNICALSLSFSTMQ